MSVSEPGKIITPWAESGLKNAIPAAANPATGRAGFDQGFSAINMTAKEVGGIPPFGQDFNGIFFQITEILRYMQAGGRPTFDAALATAIGGYPKGALVLGSDGVSVYTNRVDGNSSNPNSGGSGWAREDLMLREALRRSYAEAGLNLVEGSFELGGVLSGPNDVLLYEKDCSAWAWVGAYPHNVPEGTIPVIGSGYVPRTDLVLREQLSGNWAEGGGELSVNITETVGAGDYRLKYQKSRAALRGGLRDPLPLDDTLNHFRGLPNKDTWGNPAMQGIGSVAFGRNGASYAYLSATFGHDCVVYGAAGFAGGAGSCAGNPDLPLQDAAYGYCSFAYGKMTKAQGRTSNAMGQECQANSLVSSVDGYAAIAGPGLASHPNGVVSEGRSARAHGWDVQAYGDFAVAMGSHVRSYNGAIVIGSGYDDTHPLQGVSAGGLYLGARCTVPALSALPDGGVRDKLGMHTSLPRERVEAVIQPGEKFVVRMDDKGAGGTGTINLQATLPNDDAVNILSVIWGNTSPTSASGVAVVLINGIPSIEITATGVVNFLVGSLSISQNGQGVKLKSPDGSKTKILRLSNAGALELV